MNFFNFLFGRKPINGLAINASAIAVYGALVALETYLAAKGDKRALALVRELHRALETMWTDHAPSLGAGDVTAFSGGGPKPPAEV